MVRRSRGRPRRAQPLRLVGVDSHRWSGYAEGTRTGDSWTFNNTETMEGKTFHCRFTMTLESSTRMKLTRGMSENGETWMVMMVGTAEKN